jgi:hypothetical protein
MMPQIYTVRWSPSLASMGLCLEKFPEQWENARPAAHLAELLPPALLLIHHTFFLALPHRTAASTFEDFELASAQQRPDMVLRQRSRGLLRPEARTQDVLTKPRTSRFVKLAVMGLTVALGAAALAVVKSALEWTPKFQLQLFP